MPSCRRQIQSNEGGSRLPATALKVHGQIAFCLSLRAFVTETGRPGATLAIIFNSSVFHRSMFALKDVIENNASCLLLGNHKPQAICAALCWQMGAAGGIPKIAKVPQLRIAGSNLLRARVTCSAVAGAQRQAGREVPCNCMYLLSGIKKGARHSSHLKCGGCGLCKLFGGPATSYFRVAEVNHLCLKPIALPC